MTVETMPHVDQGSKFDDTFSPLKAEQHDLVISLLGRIGPDGLSRYIGGYKRRRSLVSKLPPDSFEQI